MPPVTVEPAAQDAEAVSVPEAARRAGVSRTLLYGPISSGELPTVPS